MVQSWLRRIDCLSHNSVQFHQHLSSSESLWHSSGLNKQKQTNNHYFNNISFINNSLSLYTKYKYNLCLSKYPKLKSTNKLIAAERWNVISGLSGISGRPRGEIWKYDSLNSNSWSKWCSSAADSSMTPRRNGRARWNWKSPWHPRYLRMLPS